MTVQMRLATIEDASAIAALNIAVYRTAYVGQIAQPVLDALDLKKRTQDFARAIQNPVRRTYVMVQGGDLLGFAISGPVRQEAELDFVVQSDDVPLGSHVGELYSIYTSPVHQGLGIGRQLLQKTQESLKEQGFKEMHIWALLSNVIARRFYLKNGAREMDVTRKISLDGFLHEEGLLVMAL